MGKRALITGITGQDGSYLAEFLLKKGYEVHGTIRRVALEDPERRLWRISHLRDRLHLHSASLESFPSMFRVFRDVTPHECYHLGAQSFVGYSFEDEFSTLNTNINGTHYALAAVRDCAVMARQGVTGARAEGAIGFAALRGGDVVGEHTVIFAGAGERIELAHKATSRNNFAAGALRAAHFVATRRAAGLAGLADMQDVLGLR